MKFNKFNISKLFDRAGNSQRSAFGVTEEKDSTRVNLFRGTCEKNDCSCTSCSANGTCRCSSGNDNGYAASVIGGSGYTGGQNGSRTPSCRDSAYGNTGDSALMRDKGNEPIVFDIRKEAFMNSDFRTALWTGGNLQLTVMTVPVGEDIGVERHDNLDQLIGVISGAGEVVFGNMENYFAPPIPLDAHSVVLVPAGTYHNVKNVGKTPLKLYSVYAPKAHKFGTVERVKDE